MKITGYMIREAMQAKKLELETNRSLFDQAIVCFEGEYPAPTELGETITQLESQIARLQTLQATYNGVVGVNVLGEPMNLSKAVKSLGGAGRIEKMWRSATGNPKRDRYHSYNEKEERDPLKRYPQRNIAVAEATRRAQEAAKIAGAYRAAIATGNAREIELDVPTDLFG